MINGVDQPLKKILGLKSVSLLDETTNKLLGSNVLRVFLHKWPIFSRYVQAMGYDSTQHYQLFP